MKKGDPSSQAKPAGNSLDFASILQQVNQQEENAKQQNTQLQEILKSQEDLINHQRETLIKVSKLSADLSNYDKKRAEILDQLEAQKTNLLLIASQSKHVNEALEAILSQSDISVSKTVTGTTVLHAIEDIQKSVFNVTESAIQNQDLSVPPELVNELVRNTNAVIENAIETGSIKEETNDKVRRQSFIINSMLSPTE